MPAEKEELTEAQWLKALRTTDLEQIQEDLTDGLGGFCCLGIACIYDPRIENSNTVQFKIQNIPIDEDFQLMTELSDEIGFSTGTPLSWMNPDQASLCVSANDEVGMTFSEIADWWEAGQLVDSFGKPQS